VEVDITIEECDETKYLNQDIENIGLKSWYIYTKKKKKKKKKLKN